MRALVVTNMYPLPEDPSFGSFVAEQVASLREAGVEVDVHFIKGYRSRLAYLHAARELRQRRAEHDLFHAHHAYAAAAALVAGCRPLLLTLHDNPMVTSPLYRLFAQAVARRADRFVAVTPAAARALGAVDYVSIPMGTDLALFYPRDKSEARRELGLAADKKYVLFAADPARRSKRYDLACEAVAIARRDDPSVELLNFFPAPREKVPLYFAAADVLVVTADVELGPLTVKEAVASARPVVSRRVGDVDFLEACPACLAVGDSATELAEGIGRAFTIEEVDPSPAAPYGLEAVARRLRELYEEVVAEQGSA
ncbi:MAG: glycosyltransferase [Candidatus Coatesbacteria bacterium]|nr:MAG: glycosyltransferase [Candidatus Coatesbacteria bacterium]